MERPLRSLLIGLLVLLPSFYFAWYFSGPFFAWPIARLTDSVLTWWWPEMIAGVGQAGSKVQILTRVGLPEIQAAAGRGFAFDVMTYSYGIPLFAALAIASDATAPQHLFRLTLGFLVLIAGVFSSLFVSILYVFTFHPDYQGVAALAQLQRHEDQINYLYFLGFMIVPRLLPVLIWVILYRDMLERILKSIRRSAGE